MKCFFAIALFLLAPSSFAGDGREILLCNARDGNVSFSMVREGEFTTYLEYHLDGKDWRTEMKALSGSELMGEEEGRLVFFEKIPGDFLFTVIRLEDFSVIHHYHLDCHYP